MTNHDNNPEVVGATILPNTENSKVSISADRLNEMLSNMRGDDKPEQRTSLGRRAFAGLVLAGVVLGGLVGLKQCSSEEGHFVIDRTEQNPTIPGQSEICNPTFEVKGVNHGERNRWFAEGIPSIKTASNPEEARNALGDWLYGNNEHPGVKDDPQLTTAVYNMVKPADVQAMTADGMVDDKHCATPKMNDAVTNIATWFAFANVSPGTAPANGVNTGTNAEGIVTVASKPGVYGDDASRKAIAVVLKDGTTMYVMHRCGQPVLTHPSQGNLPHGPTEESHPPQVVPHETPVTLNKKDPFKNIDRNSEVPDEVRKNNPSQDNKARINAGPKNPNDTPSGCDGPCPTVVQSNDSQQNGFKSESNGGNTGQKAPTTFELPPAPEVTASPIGSVTTP